MVPIFNYLVSRGVWGQPGLQREPIPTANKHDHQELCSDLSYSVRRQQPSAATDTCSSLI